MAAGWTTNDANYYIWTGDIRIPKTFDAASQAAVIMLGPSGGVAQIPALVQGDAGAPALIDSTINLTALAYDDPTADSASFAYLSTDSNGSPTYRLSLTLHKGAPGATGTSSILSASDVTGTATDGYLLSKAVGTSQATWIAPKVGGQYWPATIATTTGTAGQSRTLCSVSISPAPAFDYRVRVHGQSVITGTANTQVDLIARIGSESGDIVGRGFGVAGAAPPPTVLVSGVPAGSASSVGKVNANTATTVYLRAEQQASTTDAYTTSSSTTTFMVEVVPVP